MGSKIVFGILVVVIAAAITAALMVEPQTEPDPAAGEPDTATAAAVTATGPRADVEPSDAPIGLEVGQRAPDWTLQDAQGQTHRLSDYLGQVVVMDFWATWCGPCRKVMPDLQAFHEDFASRGVQVIGMNGSERGDPVKFMAENNYTYGLLLNSDRVMGQYGVRGIPMIYVVGVDGTVLMKHTGYIPDMKSRLVDVIEPHLAAHGL